MTPYASFSYFGFLLYPVLPALGLGLSGRLTRWFVLVVSVLMLALQFGVLVHWDAAATGRQFWFLAAYAVYEGLLVKGFSLVRQRGAVPWRGNLAVVLSLLPLAAVKLLPVVGINGFGFLGISYLTFRSLDVVLGLQDGLMRTVQLRDFWLYLLFFPTVAAGPIDRYRRFLKDWEHRRSRAEYLADLDGAVQRIFRGFLYKFLLAYWVQRYWLNPAGAHHGFWAMVSYMYAYSFYLFFDFAGYSAFAVGVSYLFGVRTPENFQAPFLSRNIRDFWNRWHISLSTWFRDHIYMRFVMTATRRKWFRDKYVASALGFMLTMGLMGFWHGLELHYILYGIYHGLLMVGFDYLSRWNKQRKVWGDGPLWRWLGVAVTFQFVCFGLLLFSGHLI